MTVDKEIADVIVAGSGIYPGDEHLPPIVEIIEYDNAWGGVSYGCVRQGAANAYADNVNVRAPRTYWRRSQ